MAGEKRKYRITAGMAVKISERIKGDKYWVGLPHPLKDYQTRRVKLIKASLGVKYIRESLQRTAHFETSSREIRLEFSYEIEEVAGELRDH